MNFFSIHPNTADIGNHALYSVRWSVKSFDHMSELAKSCQGHLNSPIIWAYGIRNAGNFLHADFAVIDVDDDSTMSIDQAMEHYGRFRHVMGTTKSDGLLKGNLTSRRYRIFVQLEKRVTDPAKYKAICMGEALRWGGDIQACGPSMHFMPLNKIISFAEVGRLLPSDISLVASAPRGASYARMMPTQPKGIQNTSDSASLEIPRYIQRWLNGDVPSGQRNLCCFKAASGLAKRNFPEDKIREIILSSSLPLDSSPEVTREVNAAIRSAMRRK